MRDNKNNVHIDDCLTGSGCKPELIEIQHHLSEHSNCGGFHLRLKLTNASDLYEQ